MLGLNLGGILIVILHYPEKFGVLLNDFFKWCSSIQLSKLTPELAPHNSQAHLFRTHSCSTSVIITSLLENKNLIHKKNIVLALVYFISSRTTTPVFSLFFRFHRAPGD